MLKRSLLILGLLSAGTVAVAKMPCLAGGSVYCHGSDGCNWTDGNTVVTGVGDSFMKAHGCYAG